MTSGDPTAKKGRRAALVIVITALAWVLITMIGEKEGFSQELRLTFDLLALCGFLQAFWLIYQIWRDSRGK